jgi:hypothetical protein
VRRKPASSSATTVELPPPPQNRFLASPTIRGRRRSYRRQAGAKAKRLGWTWRVASGTGCGGDGAEVDAKGRVGIRD